MEVVSEYKIFLEFIDAYLPQGFKDIDETDPLMERINSYMEQQDQFMYLADMLNLQILYVSPTIRKVLGIPPERFDPGYHFRQTHPDDISRHSLSRARMIQLCNDTYIKGDSQCCVMSTNFHVFHNDRSVVNLLIQGYVFVTSRPINTTYTLFINSNINWFGPIKHGYNYYLGTDMSLFRYPDKEVILTGSIFSDREFEIIQLIREGLDSKLIGERLFISPHTVDTHRRNILKKTGHNTTRELVIDLQERGFF